MFAVDKIIVVNLRIFYETKENLLVNFYDLEIDEQVFILQVQVINLGKGYFEIKIWIVVGKDFKVNEVTYSMQILAIKIEIIMLIMLEIVSNYVSLSKEDLVIDFVSVML